MVRVDPQTLPSGSHSPSKLDCGLNWLLDRVIARGRGCYGDGRSLLSWEQLRARQIPNSKVEFAEAYDEARMEQLIRRTPNTFSLQPLRPSEDGDEGAKTPTMITPDPERVNF